jgi:hypothetical protein
VHPRLSITYISTVCVRRNVNAKRVKGFKI